MRKVNLRMNENYKYEIIKLLSEGKINKERASIKLKLSTRQIYRLLNNYKESGKSSFIHGNRGRKPSISIDPSLSEKIIQLYLTKYQDFNFRHFLDMLEEYENIKVSYSCIYNTLMKNGIS